MTTTLAHPDTAWLKIAGERQWIALSHNTEIRYNRDERDIAMRAGVRLFMLIGNATHEELANNLINTLPKIYNFLNKHEGPFIARVYRASADEHARGKGGKVEMWVSHEEWLDEMRRRR